MSFFFMVTMISDLVEGFLAKLAKILQGIVPSAGFVTVKAGKVEKSLTAMLVICLWIKMVIKENMG